MPKYSTIQLGIWTVIRSPSQSPIFSWLSRARDILWEIGFSAISLSPAEKSKSPAKGNKLYQIPIPAEPDNPLFSGKAKDDSDGLASLAVLRSSAYLYIFLKEIYLLAPICVAIEILLNIWRIASAALDLYCSNRLLTLVNKRIPVPLYSSNCAFRSVEACRTVTWIHLLSYWLWHAKLRFHFCQSSYQQWGKARHLYAIFFFFKLIVRPSRKNTAILRERVKFHFLEKLMHCK